MKREEIYALVEDKLVDNNLKYADFYDVFWFYDEDQLEDIKKTLDELGIKLVKEHSNKETETKGNSDDAYKDTIKEYKKNRKESNLELCKLIQEGNQLAKQMICDVNTGLVIKYAQKYYRSNRNKHDFNDLVQAGFIGLIKAAEKFDFSFNIAFSTYAVYWIRQSILREISDKGFTIRVPVHKMEEINRFKDLDSQLAQKIPDFEERKEVLAKELGCEISEIENMNIIRNSILSPASLNTPTKSDEENELGDFIEDKSFEKPDEVWDREELRIELLKALDILNEREKEVLLLRFGFYDGEPWTLEEIGEKYNITRERVRQIESIALKKLNNTKRAKIFEEYLKDD